MKLMYWIFSVCVFTASCDLVLNFNLGGSLRLAQILMVFVCLAAMARIIQDGRILWARGATALALWVVWQTLCLPVAGSLNIALRFYALLVFTVVGIFAVLQIWGLSPWLGKMMRAYVSSFIAVSIFGLFQFAVPPLLHVKPPFMAQWLVAGRIARINGFNYEPSFFATYMFIGWVMLLDLRLSKAEIARTRWMKWGLVTVSAALVLSTSKTAYLCLIVEGLARLAPVIGRILRRRLPQLHHGRITIRIPSRRHVRFAAIAFFLLVAIVFTVSKVLPNPEQQLLSGTGLAGTQAHSVDSRNGTALLTWHAFERSPFIGWGLGGAPVAMGALNGHRVTDMADVRLFWPFPVPLEVLASSGIIGSIPFFIFLYANTFGAYRMAKRHWPEERAKWLRALARSMIIEWVVLLADQNLMRVYLWFHFAMVMVVAYHLEYAPARAAELAADPTLPPQLGFGPQEATA